MPIHAVKTNTLFFKVWNIIEGTELFTQVQDANGRYYPKSHLAEMIALLGPPPKEVIERAEYMSQVNYPSPITTGAGKPCKNAREVFGGPYFDKEGESSILSSDMCVILADCWLKGNSFTRNSYQVENWRIRSLLLMTRKGSFSCHLLGICSRGFHQRGNLLVS